MGQTGRVAKRTGRVTDQPEKPRDQPEEPRNRPEDPRNQPEEPRNRPDDPRNQPEEPRDQPEEPRNQPGEQRNQPQEPRTNKKRSSVCFAVRNIKKIIDNVLNNNPSVLYGMSASDYNVIREQSQYKSEIPSNETAYPWIPSPPAVSTYYIYVVDTAGKFQWSCQTCAKCAAAKLLRFHCTHSLFVLIFSIVLYCIVK